MVYRIPSDQDSLLIFGECEAEELTSERLRVLVWNVWKGKRGAAWRKDFLSLAGDRDLVMLQEAITTPEMSELFHGRHVRHEWHMAASFEWRFSHKTGVITGATAKPKAKTMLRGTDRELFVWTPKVSLGTNYGLGGRETLLVINTHVINFTTTRAFVRFVQQLVSLIEHHHGPVVLAGDFNTWNPGRSLSLTKILLKLGLQMVDFHVDPRLLKLDHVFTRGMKTLDAQIRSDIRSSDHFPLLLDFELT